MTESELITYILRLYGRLGDNIRTLSLTTKSPNLESLEQGARDARDLADAILKYTRSKPRK